MRRVCVFTGHIHSLTLDPFFVDSVALTLSLDSSKYTIMKHISVHFDFS